MSVALYMDHHVHAAITAGLRLRGVDVLTTFDDDTADLDDKELLRRATELDRVLFSQDRDLLVIAHQWQHDSLEFSGVIYAHQLAITIGQAINDLELIAKLAVADEMRNRIEFIPM